MEALKKEFLNNLIAVNNLAEAVADHVNMNEQLFLQLKEKTSLLNEQAIVLHHLSKSTLTVVNDPIIEEKISLPISEKPAHILQAEETATIIAPAYDLLEEAPVYVEVQKEQPLATIVEEKNIQPEPIKEESIVAPKKFKELNQFLGINDRIQIQQDLFKGDTETLQNFIKMIDSSDSSQKAIGIINGFKNQYNWDNESDPFINLISIIEQKFRS